MKKCVCSSLSSIMSLLKKAHFNYHTWFFPWGTLEQSTLILKGRGSGWRTFKQTENEGPDVRTAEGVDQCHCVTIHDYLWRVVEIRINSWALQGSQCLIIPVFNKDKKEDTRNGRWHSLSSTPGKAMEKLLLKTASKHTKGKKEIMSRQQGFLMPDHHEKKLLAQHMKGDGFTLTFTRLTALPPMTSSWTNSRSTG